MDTFDYVIVALGVALIIIGLVLFVAGKRDSQNGNQVEGFGIKLNVSNPSIILIVFGIGMVLFPRLMPNHQQPSSTSNGQTVSIPMNNAQQTPSDNSSSTESSQLPQTETESPQNVVAAPPVNAFFPTGLWYLYQYEENGIDMSGSVEGTMQFNNSSGASQSWRADIMAFDGWGNSTNYQYAGIIQFLGGSYVIDTQQSNDPNFMRQGPTNLILKMDNPQSLHVEYMYNGSQIVLHLTQ